METKSKHSKPGVTRVLKFDENFTFSGEMIQASVLYPPFFLTFIFFSKIQVIHVCFNNSDLKLELSILYETFHLLNYCKHRKVSNSLFLKKHIIIIYTMRRISQSIFSEYFILQSTGYKF